MTDDKPVGLHPSNVLAVGEDFWDKVRMCMRLLLIVLLSLTPLLGGVKVLPEGWKFEVSLPMVREDYEIRNKLVLYTTVTIPATGSACTEKLWVWSWGAKKGGERWMLNAEQLDKVFAAAAEGKAYEGESLDKNRTIRYVAQLDGKEAAVKLQLEDFVLEFSPVEQREYMEICKTRAATLAWYEKLRTLEEVPEWTEEARPPAMHGYRVSTDVGKVQVGTLGIELAAYFECEYWLKDFRREVQVDYGGEKHGAGDNARQFFETLKSVARELKRGRSKTEIAKPDSAEVYYSVEGKLAENGIEVRCHGKDTNNLKQTFTLEDIDRLERMDAKVNERLEWFRKNMALLGVETKMLVRGYHDWDFKLKLSNGPWKDHGSVTMNVLWQNDWKVKRSTPLGVEILWDGLGMGESILGKDSLVAICEACEAAAEKKAYQREMVNKAVVSTREVYGVWLVKLEKEGKVVTFQPDQLEKLRWLLKQADEVQAWYNHLLDRTEKPLVTDEHHSPVVEDFKMVVANRQELDSFTVSGWLILEHRLLYSMDGGARLQLAMCSSEERKGSEEHWVDQRLMDEVSKHLSTAIQARNNDQSYRRECGVPGGDRVYIDVKEGQPSIEIAYFSGDSEHGKRVRLDVREAKLYQQLVYRQKETAEWLEKHPEVFFTLKK